MDNRDELDALLEQEDAPWEAIDDIEGGHEGVIKLSKLLASRPDTAIKILQNKGVMKLGEFNEQSDKVFPEFKTNPILTIGSDERFPDYEQMWKQELHRRHAERERRLGKSLKRDDKTGWPTPVTVQAFVVNITRAANADKDGLVQPLLRRWQAGGCSLGVFGLPALQAVINYKWHAFARKMVLWQLAIFFVWVFSFYSFTALFQDEDLSLSLSQLAETQRGLITIIFELMACVSMVPFLILEYGTITAYGLSGWLNVWNGLDVITYTVQITVTIMHLGRICIKSDTLSILLALQCIFLLFRLQYYSRVLNRNTRYAFLEAIRDVIIDIRHYFLFLLLIFVGFASCFHVLFRKDQAVDGFDTFPHSFLKIYAQQNGLDFDDMLSSHVPVVACILNIAYAFIMGMVLINLLVGIMSNTLAKVTEHEALKLFLHKAQIIDELESTLPTWIEEKFKDVWYPKFIHVLRIDPDKIDKVDLNTMWSNDDGENGGGGGGGGDGGSGGGNMKAIEARLDEMQALLAKLVNAATAASGGGGVSVGVSGVAPVTPAVAPSLGG